MFKKEEISEKISKGWIRAQVWFDILGVDEKVTAEALKEHVEKLKKMEDVIVLSESFESVEKVENPLKNVEHAFTQAAKVELLAMNIEVLLYAVILFGPSSVEVLEPKDLKIGLDTVQRMMNAVAEVMHRYAAGGVGGIVISMNK